MISMTEYYHIKPERAGELGEKTEIDTSEHPPIVHKLHYRFHDLPEDDILKAFPCYIVSDDLKNRIESKELTGYELADVYVSKERSLAERAPDKELPKFHWLKITGTPGEDDFGKTDMARLVISDTVLELLQEVSTRYAQLEEYQSTSSHG